MCENRYVRLVWVHAVPTPLASSIKYNRRLELAARTPGLFRLLAVVGVLALSEFQFGQSRSDNLLPEVPQNTAFMPYLIRSFWGVDHS